jgi:hypothetical protein
MTLKGAMLGLQHQHVFLDTDPSILFVWSSMQNSPIPNLKSTIKILFWFRIILRKDLKWWYSASQIACYEIVHRGVIAGPGYSSLAPVNLWIIEYQKDLPLESAWHWSIPSSHLLPFPQKTRTWGCHLDCTWQVTKVLAWTLWWCGFPNIDLRWGVFCLVTQVRRAIIILEGTKMLRTHMSLFDCNLFGNRWGHWIVQICSTISNFFRLLSWNCDGVSSYFPILTQ